MKKSRLMIDFKNDAELATFFKAMQEAGIIPDHAGVFESDALDYSVSAGGVGRRHSYIVKSVANGAGRKRLTVQKEVEV
jgi:hypothetical protein